MPYIGKEPEHGNYQRIDTIVSGFNGSETTFNLRADSASVYPTSPATMIISLGGVVQEPDTSYTVSGDQITFTTAPASGTTFWGVSLGDTLDIGTVSDGSITAAKLADDAVNTDEIVDDAVTADKLANSINAEIAANTAKTGITTSQANAITANTAKVTNATHSGDVTGATTLTIANGAVDIAHLSASGTKDETTVLHGNNTFATVSAGISGHGTVVIKSSDQTVNNSTTLVNDDTLVWALAANKNYRLWAHAFIDTHIHSDFKWTFTGPSGCEIHLTVNRNYAAGASYDWHGLNSLGTAVSMNTPTDTASNWYWFGTIMNGGNAGNLQLQWAQNAAQSFDTKMHNGSWGIVELLN